MKQFEFAKWGVNDGSGEILAVEENHGMLLGATGR